MRALLWLTLLFAIAVGVALFGEFNQSNVAIFYPPYRVDLSLNLFLLLLIGIYAAAYLLMSTGRRLRQIPQQTAALRERKRIHGAAAALREAIESLFASRYARAERMAREAQTWSEQSETAALIGARAAHRLQEFGRRDAWLAQVVSPERAQARLVTTADLLMAQHDADGALAAIGQLQTAGARRIHVQELALRAHQHQKNWMEVLRLVRSLEKHKALHPVVSTRYRQMACVHLLDARRDDAPALLAFWNSLSGEEQRQEKIAAHAVRLLVATHQSQVARGIIEAVLKENWSPELVRQYADCFGTNALPLIQQVEHWLVKHPADADLHYALGRLCQHQQLWGKAQASLENALRYAQDDVHRARTHLALALLLDNLGKPEDAAQHFRQSAERSSAL